MKSSSMNPLLSEFEAEAYDLHGGVYELYDGDLETAPLNKALLAWEWAYTPSDLTGPWRG